MYKAPAIVLHESFM